MINIKVADTRLIPRRNSEGAAGYDLYLSHDVKLQPKKSELVSTGVAMEIPAGYGGLVLPRSSTGKIKISLANTVGVIDSDYRGEILVNMYNFGAETRLAYKYDTLFQLVVVPVANMDFNIVTELQESVRGSGGFGSTNK